MSSDLLEEKRWSLSRMRSLIFRNKSDIRRKVFIFVFSLVSLYFVCFRILHINNSKHAEDTLFEESNNNNSVYISSIGSKQNVDTYDDYDLNTQQKMKKKANTHNTHKKEKNNKNNYALIEEEKGAGGGKEGSEDRRELFEKQRHMENEKYYNGKKIMEKEMNENEEASKKTEEEQKMQRENNDIDELTIANENKKTTVYQEEGKNILPIYPTQKKTLRQGGSKLYVYNNDTEKEIKHHRIKTLLFLFDKDENIENNEAGIANKELLNALAYVANKFSKNEMLHIYVANNYVGDFSFLFNDEYEKALPFVMIVEINKGWKKYRYKQDDKNIDPLKLEKFEADFFAGSAKPYLRSENPNGSSMEEDDEEESRKSEGGGGVGDTIKKMILKNTENNQEKKPKCTKNCCNSV